MAQAADAGPHDVAAHARSTVDACPARTAYLPATELWFEPLGEIERDRP
jgi:hypothetical protein